MSIIPILYMHEPHPELRHPLSELLHECLPSKAVINPYASMDEEALPASTSTPAPAAYPPIARVSSFHIDQSTLDVLKSRPVILSTVAFALVNFIYVQFEESMPIFLKIDRSLGGLGFDAKDIGLVLALSGFVAFSTTVFIIPAFDKW